MKIESYLQNQHISIQEKNAILEDQESHFPDFRNQKDGNHMGTRTLLTIPIRWEHIEDTLINLAAPMKGSDLKRNKLIQLKKKNYISVLVILVPEVTSPLIKIPKK